MELFIKKENYKYGRINRCKKCNRIIVKKRFDAMTEEEREKDKEYHRVWERTNIKRRNRKKSQMRYKDKDVRFDFNLRTNVCCMCGKKYPEDLQRQTDLHHIEYSDENPLEHTIELCVGCHFKVHRTKNSWLTPIGGGKYIITRRKTSQTQLGKAVGIYQDKRSKRWSARLRYNGQEIYLGMFSTKEEAIKARNGAIDKYDWCASKEMKT